MWDWTKAWNDLEKKEKWGGDFRIDLLDKWSEQLVEIEDGDRALPLQLRVGTHQISRNIRSMHMRYMYKWVKLERAVMELVNAE